MTLMILLLATTVLVLAGAALVDLLRHDAPGSARRLPRSHPADSFDPYEQRFGRPVG